jgi:glycosyltransferase involved in cell wall biosynthesis
MLSKPLFSIVIPVYKNQSTITNLVRNLTELEAKISSTADLECIFVIDGSPDLSDVLLRKELEGATFKGSVLNLSRNFGSNNAIRAGLRIVKGEYTAVMAADLQEPLDLYLNSLSILVRDEADIVLAKRVGRHDPLVSKIFSSLYWKFYRQLVNPEIPSGGVDVFACNRKVVRELNKFSETDSNLIGLLMWLGFRRETVDYVRQPRISGSSSWTFRKKVRHLLDSVYSFTDLPIVLMQLIGVFGVSFSILAGAGIIIARLLGYVHQPGYTPLMITLFLTTSAILLALGIVGGYVSRIYTNVKQRPYFLVRDEWSWDGSKDE